MIEQSDSRPIVVDTDPGIDDALAIILALRSPELRVELMTTVAGNTDVRAATDNARRLLALLDPDEPPRLVRGAARPSARPAENRTDRPRRRTVWPGFPGQLDRHGRSALSRKRRAEAGRRERRRRRSSAKAREHGEALTIAALGPLTNIARALEEDADRDASRSAG